MRRPNAVRRLAATVLLLLTGCAWGGAGTSNSVRIPFTEQLRAQWNFTDEEIRSLQFYVNRTVVLSRQASEGSRSIARGKLVLRSGRYIDEIQLSAGTPGVATRVSNDRLSLCFEKDCSATLDFGCVSNDCKALRGGRYSSIAQEWRGTVGTVDYGGVTYSMTPATHIEVEENALAKLQRERRVLPGKRLNSR